MDRKWRLGLRIRCHPGHLIQALCRVMASFNISYKKGKVPYNLKCMVEIATGDDGESDDTSMVIDDSVPEKRDASTG